MMIQIFIDYLRLLNLKDFKFYPLMLIFAIKNYSISKSIFKQGLGYGMGWGGG